MFNNKKTLVTGGSGLVGKALEKIIPNAIFLDSIDFDLTLKNHAMKCFTNFRPDYVFHLAGVSRSVVSSAKSQGEIFYKNCLINLNVLDAAKSFDVKKLISIIDYSAYPSKADMMSRACFESDFHDGKIEAKNEGYGYSNRILDIQSRLYNQQYKTNFVTCISNNIYGPSDKFNESGRAIPAIIFKTINAIENNLEEVELHGISQIQRQFSYSEDIAKMLVLLMEKYDQNYTINIGNPSSTTIGKISEIISNELGFNGQYTWSREHQVTHKRELNIYKQNSLFPGFRWTQPKEGIKKTIEWYKRELK